MSIQVAKIHGKFVERWICPICDYRVTVVEPEDVTEVAEPHLYKRCREGRSDEVDAINRNEYRCEYNPDVSVEELLMNAVIDKL